MNTKRMAGMKLGDFSKSPDPKPPIEIEPPLTESKVQPTPPLVKKTVNAGQEKLITVNIKIKASQHEWLNETARLIRDNNTEPVPAGDRVYPQHLIGVAIELLRSSNVNLSQVRNMEDLKEHLNL